MRAEKPSEQWLESRCSNLFLVPFCPPFSQILCFLSAVLTDFLIMVLRFPPIKDIDFPLVFKIMAYPAFDMGYLEEVGYETVFDYFHGTTGQYDKRSFVG